MKIPFRCLLTIAGLLPAFFFTARAAVVTTADNNSTAGDGKTSLVEALSALTDGETITFNIPGAGPHYLETPTDGYPLIEHPNITIDGYSQPGASPNTNGLRSPNNAVIKIVLDSRAGGRRVIDFPGFGTSESAVLPVFDSTNFHVRGLAFIGVIGEDSDESPVVYCVALIEGSTDAKVQGCWFGLDPAASPYAPDADGIVPGIHGARSAVASFQGNTGSASGLLIGTDSDGVADNGEFNILVGQSLAIHLQTPDARVSGNYINYLPDGRVFSYETQQLELLDGSFEAIENGNGLNMQIGTNGDGVNDANESNFIGPVNYDVFAEFWRSAEGIVVAGNYFGIGPDGWPSFVHSRLVSLVQVRNNSSIRIGSDLNGTGDAAEANHIYGTTDKFINFHGSNNNAATVVRISLRGNELIDNYGELPLDKNINVSPEVLYGFVMLDPTSGYRPTLNAASTTTTLKGTVPAPSVDTLPGPVELDVYLADLPGLYHTSPDYPVGYAQGRYFLGRYLVDGAGDTDILPNTFSFNVSSLQLTATELSHLVATANYTLLTGQVVTSNFSDPLSGGLVAPASLMAGPVGLNGASFQLSWTGGTPPFAIESSTSLIPPWTPAMTTSNQNASIPLSGLQKFFRVHENASPR